MVRHIVAVYVDEIDLEEQIMGFGHWLNARRQILKFYKDIYQHYCKNRYFRKQQEQFDSRGDIPKVIHYAWFGKGEMPDVVKKCLATWPKFLTGYEVKLWDESNFPIDEYPFAKQAYEQKKYAFVADVARLHAIYYYGGIYMDTDCEVLKNFDDLLHHNVFACYESPNLLSIGTVGAKKHHPWIYDMLTWYQDVDFCDDYAEIASTRIYSKMARVKYGIKLKGQPQDLPNGVHIYTRDYFCPEKLDNAWGVTENTYVIHHFTGLW